VFLTKESFEDGHESPFLPVFRMALERAGRRIGFLNSYPFGGRRHGRLIRAHVSILRDREAAASRSMIHHEKELTWLRGQAIQAVFWHNVRVWALS